MSPKVPSTFIFLTPLKQVLDYHGYIPYNPTSRSATSDIAIINKIEQSEGSSKNFAFAIAITSPPASRMVLS
jgi:hypothetical protein